MSEQPPQNPPQPPQGPPPNPAQPPPPNPYQQPPQNPYQPYGAPGYNQSGVPQWAPDHPQATTVLILGILGMAVCQLAAPFAWVIGGRVKREIDASGGQYAGRSQVQIGYILGIVGTALLILGLLFFVFYIVLFVFIFGSTAFYESST